MYLSFFYHDLIIVFWSMVLSTKSEESQYRAGLECSSSCRRWSCSCISQLLLYSSTRRPGPVWHHFPSSLFILPLLVLKPRREDRQWLVSSTTYRCYIFTAAAGEQSCNVGGWELGRHGMGGETMHSHSHHRPQARTTIFFQGRLNLREWRIFTS